MTPPTAAAPVPDVGIPLAPPDVATTWLRFGETPLDPRRNSLNLIRLVLALAVLVSHGWALSGYPEPEPGGEKIGTWAVFGFFALSGYLITGSRLTSPLSSYLLRRVARIFPAFIVCLAITAFGFAPLAYWQAHHSLHGFLSTPTTPVTYVMSNLGLKMAAFDVAGTPSGVPYPNVWDGSLWSLFLEFWCYVIVAAVFSFVALRRRPALTLGVGLAGSVLATALMPRLGSFTQGSADLSLLAWLLPFFLAGGLIRVLPRPVVLTWPGAVVSALGIVVIAAADLDYGPHVAALPVVYLLLWAGAVLPCPEWVRRNDVSYGAYIYAFPAQQMLLVLGATAWPLLAFDAAAVLLTIPLAVASWFLVEHPLMSRAQAVTRRTTPVPALPA